ncbi:MAG: hypothetical protein ACQKBW_09630 [Puniceicoccales bacterium]
MTRLSPKLFATALATLGVLSGCTKDTLKSPDSAPVTPVAQSTETQQTALDVAEFEAPAYLPALGDEKGSKPNRQHKRLPPPPAPKRAEIEKIAKLLTKEPVGVGAPASNRQVWDKLAAQPQAKDLIAKAEKALKSPIVPLTAELWQQYDKTGDRVAYQNASSSRYNRLRDLALGEALEYKGRFLPAIEENLTAILDQGSWSVPAHGKSMDVFEGKKFVVELASCQLAWTLATIDYWLADELPSDLRARTKAEIERRVLNPYLNAIRTGKVPGWMTKPNNWTAVCGGAVTGAALTLDLDPMVRAEFIADAEVILGRYIGSFTEEGVSEEGVGYWSYGFSHFLYASEIIRRSTGGAIDLLDDEKVFRISQAPISLEISDRVYGAFGDQSANGKPSQSLLNFSALRYGLPGNDPAQFGKIETGSTHPLGAQAYSLIVRSFGDDTEPVEGFNAQASITDDPALRTWFPESELYIYRPGQTDAPAMGMAMRISNNGESHNHNDIGSYVIVYKGVPVLLDPGMERYTAKSFSPQRYDVALNNSYGHPVPLVANRMQKSGPEASGEVISAVRGDKTDTITVDLTEAYRAPDLDQLIRTMRYERPGKSGSGAITLTDCVTYSQPQNFSTALITRGTFEILDNATVKVTDKGVSLYVTIDTQGQPFAFAQDGVYGFYRPQKAVAKRLGIYLVAPVKSACISISISPTPSDS